jgi:hypothetical protein
MTPEPRDLTERSDRTSPVAQTWFLLECEALKQRYEADRIRAQKMFEIMAESEHNAALLERVVEVLSDVRRELCGVPFGSEHAIDALLTELKARAG